MTTTQKDLVKATVPVLKEHGVALTTHFYQRMFTHNPELKHMFNMGNQQNQRQQTALAMAVLAYAEHIEDPSVLLPVVDSIGHKHTSLSVRPEHYEIVGSHLIASIGEVLGEAATPELLEAWTLAYGQLAALMSGHEQGLYREQVQQPGGWSGWRPFVVKRKEQESEEISSFYLYPADGGKVAGFTPGQYLSLSIFLPELNLRQPRQYSLSGAPNDTFYRISVKREKDNTRPDGMVSNRLHDNIQPGDIVEVAAPAGTFMLHTTDAPVVFISGGVGQTPLLSMLESLIQKKYSHSIAWIHGCRNREVHAFKSVVEDWTGRHPGLKSHIFYDSVETGDTAPIKGWVDLAQIDEDILASDAEYYICGPAPFIRKHYEYLTGKGINKAAIRFEEFGPASLQLQ